MSATVNYKAMIAESNIPPFIKLMDKLKSHYSSDSASCRIMGMERSVLQRARNRGVLSAANASRILSEYKKITSAGKYE